MRYEYIIILIGYLKGTYIHIHSKDLFLLVVFYALSSESFSTNRYGLVPNGFMTNRLDNIVYRKVVIYLPTYIISTYVSTSMFFILTVLIGQFTLYESKKSTF